MKDPIAAFHNARDLALTTLRAEIQTLESELAAKRATLAEIEGRPVTRRTRMSHDYRAQILAVLGGTPKPMKRADILAAIPEGNEASIAVVLSKLKKEGKLINRAGTYKLAPEVT